jgi:ribonuclease VapC
MTHVVLDASAPLALLRNEPGWERVHDVLAKSAMTTVNLAEVIGHFVRNGASESDIRMVLAPLPVELIPFDDETAYTGCCYLRRGEQLCRWGTAHAWHLPAGSEFGR